MLHPSGGIICNTTDTKGTKVFVLSLNNGVFTVNDWLNAGTWTSAALE